MMSPVPSRLSRGTGRDGTGWVFSKDHGIVPTLNVNTGSRPTSRCCLLSRYDQNKYFDGSQEEKSSSRSAKLNLWFDFTFNNSQKRVSEVGLALDRNAVIGRATWNQELSMRQSRPITGIPLFSPHSPVTPYLTLGGPPNLVWVPPGALAAGPAGPTLGIPMPFSMYIKAKRVSGERKIRG